MQIKFHELYWGIDADFNPVVFQVTLGTHTTHQYESYTNEVYTMWVHWRDDLKEAGFYHNFDGTHRLFDSLSEAMAAKNWLLEKPGRSLYNYKKKQAVA